MKKLAAISCLILLWVSKLHAQDVVFRTDTAEGFKGVFCIGPLVLPKDPMVVIDDKCVSNETFKKLDTKTFANVRILRDSVGALLYGPSAKYGVVVITTKKKYQAKK